MDKNRMLRLAKANKDQADTLTPLKDVFTSQEIRKKYDQSDVEALIVNCLADIINALETNGTVEITTEHFTEFKKFLAYRDTIKANVKQEVFSKESE